MVSKVMEMESEMGMQCNARSCVRFHSKPIVSTRCVLVNQSSISSSTCPAYPVLRTPNSSHNWLSPDKFAFAAW